MRTGRIYTIRSPQTDKYYIGSTFQTLSKRIGDHRSDYKGNKRYMASYEILKYEDHYIELLETLECKSKDELRKREGEMQREHKNDIVNCRIEQRTRKEYLDDNKEKLIEQTAKYRKMNLEKIKVYYLNNRKTFITNRKEYYIINKNKINDKRRNTRYICICGSNIRKDGKKEHERSKRHQKYISDNNL